MGHTKGSLSDSENSSFVNRVASAGTEQMDWIGPIVHIQCPLAATRKIAGDQHAGYLGPTTRSTLDEGILSRHAPEVAAQRYQTQSLNTSFQVRSVNSTILRYALNRFLIKRLPDGISFNVKQDLVNTARKLFHGILVLCAN